MCRTGQLLGVSTPFAPCWLWGSNSGHQSWGGDHLHSLIHLANLQIIYFKMTIGPLSLFLSVCLFLSSLLFLFLSINSPLKLCLKKDNYRTGMKAASISSDIILWRSVGFNPPSLPQHHPIRETRKLGCFSSNESLV